MANPTIGVTTPRIQYTATASQTVFTVPFEFLANADLAVYVDGVLKTLTTDYTLTGANTSGGGTLTFVTGRTAGEIVTILGDLAYSRDTNKYTKYGLLPAEVLEADFDAMQVQVKQLARDGQFALRAPLTDTGTPDMVLPAKATRATKVLGFDSDGDPVASASSVADIDATVQIIDALNALPAGASSSISYQPAGTGAVTTTVQAKLRETVSVKDFGAVGDGTTDDTAAIQAAINAQLCVDFGGPSNSFKVNGTITLRTGQRITANGASITQTAIRTQIFDASAKNNIEISGLSFVGVGSDFNNSAGSRADGVYTSGSNRLVIRDCTFTNCSHSALTAVASTDIQFLNNTVTGMGSPTLTAVTSGGCVGVVIDVGCNGAIIDGNTITQTSMGVQTGDSCLNVRVTNNYIYSIIGQHGFYGGGAQTNLVVSNNTIKDTSLIGIKVQQYDTPAANTQNVTITGNAIYTTGSGGDGIALLSTTSSPTYLILNVTVSGNTVYSSGQDGISIKNVKYGVVANNVVNGTSREGISHSANTAVQICNNTIYAAGNSGIREVLATAYCSIVGNLVIDPAVNATVGQKFGIYITTGSQMLVADNIIVDTQAKMQYGFFIEGGTQTTFTLRNNYTAGATAQGLRTVVATAFRYYGGNVMTGTGGDTTGTTNVNQRGDLRVFYSTAVPASGAWLVGDYVRNSAPAVGQPKGWYCTVAGSPGTWVSEGNL